MVLKESYLRNKEQAEIYSQRISRSASLLREPLRDLEKGYDKVYALASGIRQQIGLNGSIWFIDVNSKDPTVVLDDKSKDILGLKNTPKVNDIRKGDGKYLLFSGGAWIWIEDSQGNRFLTLLRRDEGAPTDAGCLTGPAGRCGEPLSKTTIDETNQELIFLQTEIRGKRKLLVFYRETKDIEEAKRQKLIQVKNVRQELWNKWQSTRDETWYIKHDYLKKNIQDEDDLEMIKIDANRVGSQEPDIIKICIDGKVIDQIRGVVFMDWPNKTLEVRQVINYKLPPGMTLEQVMDGEIFLRKTILVPEREVYRLLTEDKPVFSLSEYIKTLPRK